MSARAITARDATHPATLPVEDVGTEVGPAELAQIANREHALARQAAESMALHALRAGAALLEAKAVVRHGEWKGWLKANFDGSVRTAQRYMRIARNAPRVADLGLEGMSLGALDQWLARASYAERVEPPECADCGATGVQLFAIPHPLRFLYWPCRVGLPDPSGFKPRLDLNPYCEGCWAERWKAMSEEERQARTYEDPSARVEAFKEVLRDLGDAFGPGTSYAAGLRDVLAKLEGEAKGVASEFPGALAALDAAVSEIEEAVAAIRAYVDAAGKGEWGKA